MKVYLFYKTSHDPKIAYSTAKKQKFPRLAQKKKGKISKKKKTHLEVLTTNIACTMLFYIIMLQFCIKFPKKCDFLNFPKSAYFTPIWQITQICLFHDKLFIAETATP